MQVRVPTNVVSSICDDRGEEPTYNGVDMSTLISGDYGVGDVISLLWFKRALPKYATRFIDMCLMLCADHGPCVSGESLLPLLRSPWCAHGMQSLCGHGLDCKIF
jgi:ATP citrate (pro-S)-lyase